MTIYVATVATPITGKVTIKAVTIKAVAVATKAMPTKMMVTVPTRTLVIVTVGRAVAAKGTEEARSTILATIRRRGCST